MVDSSEGALVNPLSLNGQHLTKKGNRGSFIVSGASGFIGRHIVKNLIETGFTVFALVRDLAKAKGIKQLSGAVIIRFDLNESSPPEGLPTDSVFIHCAWEDAYDWYNFDHIRKHFHSNLSLLISLVSQGIRNLCVVGTRVEFGLHHGPVSHSTPTNPILPYGISKDTLYRSLRAYQQHLPFNLVWARVFYAYGPGQFSDGLIGRFDQALENGDQVFDMSPGDQLFDFLPVETVAQTILSMAEERNGTFNVRSGQPQSVRSFLESRVKQSGKALTLRLGVYDYKNLDTIAIWGNDIPNGYTAQREPVL